MSASGTSGPPLTIAFGARLGPYEIVSPLGVAGPALARVQSRRERWRGLAEAPTARTLC
jgi:hypothetical protein